MDAAAGAAVRSRLSQAQVQDTTQRIPESMELI